MSLVPEELLKAFAQWAETEENQVSKRLKAFLWVKVLPLSRGVAQQKYIEIGFVYHQIIESSGFKVL